MALTITKNAPNFPFQVIAQNDAGLGAPLPAEAAGVKVTANPEGIAAVSLDPNPVPVSNPFDPASGTKSVISGVVNATAVGNTTATAAVLNPDGTSLVEATDTITVIDPAEGTAPWSGTLFGAAVPLVIPAAGAATKASKTETGHKAAAEHRNEEDKPRSHHR